MRKEIHSPANKKKMVDSMCRQYSGNTKELRLAAWSLEYFCSLVSSSKVTNYDKNVCIIIIKLSQPSLTNMDGREEQKKSINTKGNNVRDNGGGESHSEI